VNSKKLSVVIPAYNEEGAIAEVVEGVQAALNDIDREIIVVDDCSSDRTAEKAKNAGATVVSHHANRGYGAALKTGIRKATHEWIAILDADGQHDPADLLRLLEALEGDYDSVIGARDPNSFQYTSRMPGKAFLQWFSGILVGEKPADLNSGLRLFKKKDVLNYFPILPNKFSFTTTLTLAMLKDAYEIGTIPIQTESRQGRPSTVSIKDGLRTLILIMRVAMLFNPLKIFIPVSAALVGLGCLYGVTNIVLVEWNIPSGAELLVISGLIVFFFGVLADQMASIRRGG